MIIVTGKLLDVDANPIYAEVTASSLDGPIMIAGGTLIGPTAYKTKTNPSTGYWSMGLEAGDYSLAFSYNNSLSPTSIQISVPSGSGTNSVDNYVSSSVVFLPSAPSYSVKTGSYAISSGVSSGTISTSFGFTPSCLVLTVTAPSNGLSLVATTMGTPTSSGFSFLLNGITDSVSYVLNWIAAP
jgi:hypothetical protein